MYTRRLQCRVDNVCCVWRCWYHEAESPRSHTDMWSSRRHPTLQRSSRQVQISSLIFPVFIHRRRVSRLLRAALAAIALKFNMYPHVRSWSAIYSAARARREIRQDVIGIYVLYCPRCREHSCVLTSRWITCKPEAEPDHTSILSHLAHVKQFFLSHNNKALRKSLTPCGHLKLFLRVLIQITSNHFILVQVLLNSRAVPSNLCNASTRLQIGVE